MRRLGDGPQVGLQRRGLQHPIFQDGRRVKSGRLHGHAAKKKKKSPTASRDIRTALAVTGVHELMCGRPHCVGAFASRCVGASSCSALTALLHSSSGVNSTPSSLRREHVRPEPSARPGPLEYCAFASHLRRWDRKMCERNATTREAAPPLQGRRGQLADLRNRMGTEGLAWWPCAAGHELPEPPDYGRRMRWSCFVDDSAEGRGLLMMTLMMMMMMMMMMIMSDLLRFCLVLLRSCLVLVGSSLVFPRGAFSLVFR